MAALLLTGRPAPGGRGLAGVEIVPVHDRVEAERVGTLRLPPPERPDREHDDVAFAERVIERRRAVREELTVGQRAPTAACHSGSTRTARRRADACRRS